MQGPARVTDVAAPFAMSLAGVSKHVKVLERAGLIRRTRNGREHTLLFYTAVEHEGTTYGHYGRILQLERGKVVQHTWVSQATKGLESVVTMTFEPRDGGTFVTLRHTGVPDDEEGRQHVMGWDFVLGSLAKSLPKR